MPEFTMVSRNFDGQGARDVRSYSMPSKGAREYWSAVTDVPCPTGKCSGTIRWNEAGYVASHRTCDKCGAHFMAGGNSAAPTLEMVTFGILQQRDKIQETCIARMNALGLNPNRVSVLVGDSISRTHITDYLSRRKSMGSHKLCFLLTALGLKVTEAK